MTTTNQLTLDFGVSPVQACIMCHLSSECHGCCKRCNNDHCQGQLCSQVDMETQGARWRAWVRIVRDCLPELIQYVPEKYRKQFKQAMK